MTAKELRGLAAMAVSVVGGWLLVRATDQLWAGAFSAAPIVAVARAMLRDGIRGPRLAFLVFAAAAVGAYAAFLALFFAETG